MAKSLKTIQREAIRQFLEGNTTHPTVADIYAAVSRTGAVTSITTVYNVLAYLKKQGIVRELPALGGEGRRFDANPRPHDHLICTACHAIVDIDLPHELTLTEEQRHGFAIADITIHVYGLCPECQQGTRKAVARRRTKLATPKSSQR
ncbi:MAG: transcriptional repressor [Syntrophales bacterium]|nr:transcriptional repressor [Syntrophales bacterium]